MMYILLKHYNDYDQHGGYFAGVFGTHEEAVAAVDHLDRVDFENSWYELVYSPVGAYYNQEED